MGYRVVWKRKLDKQIAKLPQMEKFKFVELVNDLKRKGVIQPEWPNYSKLGDNAYHCHLSRKWIACWKWFEENIVIEVYYAGSRENAPY